MRRLLAGFAVLGASVAAAAASAGGPSGAVHATAIGRMPFPDRGYVLDLPEGAPIDQQRLRVTENGAAVSGVSLRPLAGSSVRQGVVLALDSSDSMAGEPFASALDAARTFVARQGAGERIGLLSFNGSLHVLSKPTLDESALLADLAKRPALGYGTRILDALDQSLTILEEDNVSAGAVVLLSDGADVGSRASFTEVVAKARAEHVRIFTVALRSSAFDAKTLRALAEATGGSYTEAASAAGLKSIYSALGRRLATEYVLQYRSAAPPKSDVNVAISIDGVGTTTLSYTAPSASPLSPYHRSLLSRFVLSWISLALLSLLIAAVVGWILHTLVDRSRSHIVERIEGFLGRTTTESAPEIRRLRRSRAAAAGSSRLQNWFSRLEHDLELARIDMPASRIAGMTGVATVAVLLILALISPVLALLAVLMPFGVRALIRHKVHAVRTEFAEQLPENIQIVASALRAGHGFLGALANAVQHAHEPSRQEFARVVADESVGVPLDEAIRKVAVRMASRDLEQVALVAELARTTGGNSAEVLDTVVESIRARGDVRRLVQVLTVQGRMARWILTCLPVVTGFAFYALEPDVVGPMFHSGIGQVLLIICAGMVAAGSAVIQRIVEIDV